MNSTLVNLLPVALGDSNSGKTFESTLVNMVYLFCAILFVFGLKLLSSPKTARRGNALSAIAMLLAITFTLYLKWGVLALPYIIMGLVIGGLIGAIGAKKVQMTGMPQMVALFNGFGGAASALVAFADYWSKSGGNWHYMWILAVVLSLLIGTVTLFGSLIAFAKLQGIMRGAPITYRGQNYTNALLLLAILGIGALIACPHYNSFGPFNHTHLLLAIITLSAVLGVTSVISIGGADMPVVISLLNSYSGLAAAATGFVLGNSVLIISGSLVGASGIILTKIMCVAMNRSLGNVLFSAVGTDDSSGQGGDEKRNVIRYTAQDAVMQLENAQSIIVVPGYGLAVAQAQHVLHEMSSILINRGIQVRYAIHPVAGRMPGHMNVLLAEANVDYDLLCEMDINEDMPNTDVVMVIGANDVVNPAARSKKDSPLYGMPIFNVDYARTVMVFKRSLGAGFAGEANELFFNDNTMMVFGDAKKSIAEIAQLLKSD